MGQRTALLLRRLVALTGGAFLLVKGWSAFLQGEPVVVASLRVRVPAILVVVGGCWLLIAGAGPWNHRAS